MNPDKQQNLFKQLRILLPVIGRLGIGNVVRVAIFRMRLRRGFYLNRLPAGNAYGEDLFKNPWRVPGKFFSEFDGQPVIEKAENLVAGRLTYFSFHDLNAGSPPDWFRNPINLQRIANPGEHWSAIDDFGSGIGDIKVIWEPSRFDWALVFARAFCLSSDPRYLQTLNAWCRDWIKNNPLNSGPNWKCGQEAGIRMLQLLLAAYLLQQHEQPAEGLIRFVSEHCGRIEPTIRYAIAQDNNHGTSEAAALFIGGAWLEKYGGQAGVAQKARRWKIEGRKWLENRVARLVGKDGSFSQHSLNYHRLLLETLNLVEFWRRELSQKDFSPVFYARCRAVVEWLYQMVDEESGDAPNLGPNDGARLFPLANADYRDFRPTVQLGTVLFMGGRVYPKGAWDEPLFWLKLDKYCIASPELKKRTMEFPDGGYVTFQVGGGTWGLLRYPRFRFRPAHADAFHFDLWTRGRNVLRDSGSYSYNTEEPWQSYFASTRAHNTIEFDGKDQMPSIGTFLRGCWLQARQVSGVVQESKEIFWTGSFRDYQRNMQKRTIEIAEGIIKVRDEIEGRWTSAVLRWRLIPDEYIIVGQNCISKMMTIQIMSNNKIKRFELVEGWESIYYLQRSSIPVLEVEIEGGKAIITSEFHLQ